MSDPKRTFCPSARKQRLRYLAAAATVEGKCVRFDAQPVYSTDTVDPIACVYSRLELTHKV
jgi:hypothetical protein